MTIELLYIDGCPGAQQLLLRLRELLDPAAADATIELRLIKTDRDAQRERFLGSPTLRIEGHDIDPDAHAREDYGIKCRLYATPTGPANTPPDTWVRAAITRATAPSR